MTSWKSFIVEGEKVMSSSSSLRGYNFVTFLHILIAVREEEEEGTSDSIKENRTSKFVVHFTKMEKKTKPHRGI